MKSALSSKEISDEKFRATPLICLGIFEAIWIYRPMGRLSLRKGEGER